MEQIINPVIFSNLLKLPNVLPSSSTGTNRAGRPKANFVHNFVVHSEQQKRKIAHC